MPTPADIEIEAARLAGKLGRPAPRIIFDPDRSLADSQLEIVTGRLRYGNDLLGLPSPEWEVVVAHEIGHMRQKTVMVLFLIGLVAALAVIGAALAGVISAMSPYPLWVLAVVLIVGPLVLAWREFDADRFAADQFGSATVAQSYLRLISSGSMKTDPFFRLRIRVLR